MESTYLRVCELEKYYGKKHQVKQVIHRLSFAVAEGEFVGIMGPSGSGKTTLLNLLAAIDQVTAGHIYYGNQDITEMTEDQLADFRKYQLGFVFQDFNLLDMLTVEENIVLAMALQKKRPDVIRETVKRLAGLLGIEDVLERFPYEISGGQRQRCACARALANEPRLILADEPTGALDSKAARMLMETFSEMNETLHTTILMVTHDAFAASYCSRILFLKDGKIFHECDRGTKTRTAFFHEILDVLSLTGGDLG